MCTLRSFSRALSDSELLARNQRMIPWLGRQTSYAKRLFHFRPSFLPAASRAIDSRMRFSRVSGRFAV